jgi:hypothetical protein
MVYPIYASGVRATYNWKRSPDVVVRSLEPGDETLRFGITARRLQLGSSIVAPSESNS